MLPQSILNKILDKYGKETIYSADCAPLAEEIGIGETTVKRMFGLVGPNSPERNRVPHKGTMAIVAKWLGYNSYDELLTEIGEGNTTSEFASVKSIEVGELEVGTKIQLKYEPGRKIVMTYEGDGEFLVDESKNSKLLKDDRIRLSHLVVGHEMIVTDVIRNGQSLGSYRGAKDGGMTELEILF